MLLSHEFHTRPAAATFHEAALSTSAGVAPWCLLLASAWTACRCGTCKQHSDEGYPPRTPHRNTLPPTKTLAQHHGPPAVGARALFALKWQQLRRARETQKANPVRARVALPAATVHVRSGSLVYIFKKA